LSIQTEPRSDTAELTWVEISKQALVNNIRQFRRILKPDVRLCVCVKANAYGHGLLEASRVFIQAGADWLAVNSLCEARTLRHAGVQAPLYIIGYVPLSEISDVLELNCRMVVYNEETIRKIGEIAGKQNHEARLHLKVETGTNRQGVSLARLPDIARLIRDIPSIHLEGLSTHFANIEDTTDHSYAFYQLEQFARAGRVLEGAGLSAEIRNCANSAATILFPEIHFDMVRVGISAYGMWPSNETYVSYVRERENGFELIPALTWKTRVIQIKDVPAGEYVGYGCTYRTSHDTRLAVLPVGYYDGFDRGVQGGHVLIHGSRAPLRGRICMNMIMVEITDIPGVQLEDEVILIGSEGEEVISAEMFGDWAGTINYEVTTRINERVPRRLID